VQATGIKYAVLVLPIVTGSCARGANTIGDFGLVGQAVTNCYHGLACAGGRRLVGLDPVTNRYQGPDLALGLPRKTFTNLYHRDEGTGYRTEHSGQHRAPGGWVEAVGPSYLGR
jgi:hypothetical protein